MFPVIHRICWGKKNTKMSWIEMMQIKFIKALFLTFSAVLVWVNSEMFCNDKIRLSLYSWSKTTPCMWRKDGLKGDKDKNESRQNQQRLAKMKGFIWNKKKKELTLCVKWSDVWCSDVITDAAFSFEATVSLHPGSWWRIWSHWFKWV